MQKDIDRYLETAGLTFSYNGNPITSSDFFEVGDGWLPMIQELIEKLIVAGWDKQVSQVKEKFGGLRFYINSGSDLVYNIISEYENKSYTICEICGEPGELYSKNRWYVTLCEKCKTEEHIKCEKN